MSRISNLQTTTTANNENKLCAPLKSAFEGGKLVDGLSLRVPRFLAGKPSLIEILHKAKRFPPFVN